MPLSPNDEIPALRGPACDSSLLASHGTGSHSSDTAPLDHSTFLEGSSTCRVRGSTPWRSACTILITPATPAAAWVWPMFDFTDPTHSGRPAVRSCPYVASSACASIGSPRTVPVPWPSTASTAAAGRPAFASAWRITRCWEGPFGAVRPLLAPSWLTALPRTTPHTRRPARSASESRSRSTTPAPSDQLTPSAASANALHRPSGASTRWRENSTNAHGVLSTVAPPASASEHSPARSAAHARCSATSEDEHAVSTVTAGPSRPIA